MIHDGCGLANYTARQNNFCLSFSRAHVPRWWTPFFALIVEIICMRKSRKTWYLLLFHRLDFFLLRSLFFLSFRSQSLRVNANIHVMIRHFAGISARSVTHRLLVQILRAPDTNVTVMTSTKNVDDTKIRIPLVGASRSSALSLKSPLFPFVLMAWTWNDQLQSWLLAFYTYLHVCTDTRLFAQRVCIDNCRRKELERCLLRSFHYISRRLTYIFKYSFRAIVVIRYARFIRCHNFQVRVIDHRR